jgi:hypothetical protein
MNWHSEKFIEHLGIAVFHAYKDEYSDIPLENWYTLSEFHLPGSEHEFDVRELKRRLRDRIDNATHLPERSAIQLAIELGWLQLHSSSTEV